MVGSITPFMPLSDIENTTLTENYPPIEMLRKRLSTACEMAMTLSDDSHKVGIDVSTNEWLGWGMLDISYY